MTWQQIRQMKITKGDCLILIGVTTAAILLGLQIQLAYSQSVVEDKLKIAPLQGLCGPQYSPCVDILHESNNTIVLKGDEFVPNIEPGGMEFMLNPGLWKIVDFYVASKGYAVNNVLYVENEDVNSYRVILTK